MSVNIAMFSLAEQQEQLENSLEDLRKQRDSLTREIISARKELDTFLHDNGNIRIQAENKARWEAMQPELAERRKDPDWQKWREEFMKSRPKSVSANVMKNPNAFVFVHESMTDDDKELFLGPLDGDEEFVIFDDTWAMAQILVHVGVFPSLSQARKNGGDGPVPQGFSDFSRGKNERRKEITILNKF